MLAIQRKLLLLSIKATNPKFGRSFQQPERFNRHFSNSSLNMQRSINDFFGVAKKPKIAESNDATAHQISPAAPIVANLEKQSKATSAAKVQEPENLKKRAAPETVASDHELTQGETMAIQENKKKALAKRLASYLTEPSWKEALSAEFEKPYFIELASYLDEQRKTATVYPAPQNVFNALNTCPLDTVKVVVIGQDPYHGPNQAHGLCFSVLPGIKPPPSLANMFKELKTDIPGFTIPKHGNLIHWSKQGVLLLNAVLTVRNAEPNAHQSKGWEQFTDACIAAVSKKQQSVVFLLWGAPAQKKAKVADAGKHNLLKAPHPSPLSASRGFFGCHHFSQCNQLLKQVGKDPINWQLPTDPHYDDKPNPGPSATDIATSSANSGTSSAL